MNLESGKHLSNLTFHAETEELVLKAALDFARLHDKKAFVGPTGRVVYPHGSDSKEIWVLPRRKV